MKILVVDGDEANKDRLSYHLKPIGFEILLYNDPVKATDNFEELDPEMIVFNAQAVPRHWKPMLKLLRAKKTKEETVFVLSNADNLPLEEAAKASHLGVNGIVCSLEDKRELHRLEELFRRYRSLKDKRRFHRLVPGSQDVLRFLFTHPLSMQIVTGSLIEISIKGASFLPTDPARTSDLKRGQRLAFCSLRVGEDIIALTCKVTRNRRELGLQFKSFETGGHHILFQYLQARSARDLKSATAKEKAIV
jgi:DNA-binding response OmpR family regulator